MATTVSTMTETQQSHDVATSAGDDQFNELPTLLQRSSTIHNPSPGFSHRHRHSKKLSLSFPILVPVMHDSPLTGNGSLSSLSQSPVVPSPYRNGTPISGVPLPSPEQLQETESPDFLTLIAGQERRVMELKEELQKAESQLQGLKKQWAMFEAKKKHAELRNKTVKLGPVSPQTVATSAEDEEMERTRRREAREKKMKDLAMKEAGIERSNSGSNKGKGGRVFAGRHTRTLSLLQNNPVAASDQTQANNKVKNQSESNVSVSQQRDSTAVTPITNTEQDESNTRRQSRASLSRQATLQDLIANSATGSAQLSFGKTYKDLASASRKSLPPGTDIFVKQGKQVYEGINQGFWNFVEDIRQATVGDEPVHGPPAEPRKEARKPKPSKKHAEPNCERHSKTNSKQGERKKNKQPDEHKGEKDNFWKEFGLETPKGNNPSQSDSSKNVKVTKVNGTNGIVKDHESKSSTDSKCPPSLLADLMDVNDDDEAWDNWPVDSPSAKWLASSKVRVRNTSEDEDSEDDENEEDVDDSKPDTTTKFVTRKAGRRSVERPLTELSA